MASKSSVKMPSRSRCDACSLAITFSIVGDVRLTETCMSSAITLPSVRAAFSSMHVSGANSTSASYG